MSSARTRPRPELLVLVLLVLGIAGCTEDELPAPDLHADYYPVHIGHWVNYAVDSIRFDDFTDPVTIDTLSVQIRHAITDTFRDLDGRLVHRLERFRRPDEASSWAIDAVGEVLRTERNIQEDLFDLRFVRLIFPPRDGATFEGHVYINTAGNPPYSYLDPDRYDWTHRVVDVHQPFTVGALTFDSTVTVQRIDDENAFEKKLGVDVYAKGVGLVYRDLLILETQQPPSGVPFVDRAERGFIVRYRAIDHAP